MLIYLIWSLQSSHLALIDTLMMAYTVEMVSMERVMSCIGRYTSAEQSHGEGHLQELPYDTEDAIVTWINKVRTGALLCSAFRDEPQGQCPQTSSSLQQTENTLNFDLVWRGDEACADTEV